MLWIKFKIRWSSIVSRGFLFLLIWWILTDGAVQSWWIGLPAVLLAVIVSTAQLPPVPLVWHKLLWFVPSFLLRSLLGGMDVAWRAFHPRMPIAPDLIEYPLQLPPGLPQVFMTNTISLLPGTLSAELGQGILQIHVLDSQKDFLAEVKMVEHSVARMFDISLKGSNEDE